jgi:hypothetical protein
VVGAWNQVAKAAGQENNLAVAEAVLERLPSIAEEAANQGDERLLSLLEQIDEGADGAQALLRPDQ